MMQFCLAYISIYINTVNMKTYYSL